MDLRLKLIITLQQFEYYFPDLLGRLNIHRCEKCDGKGILNEESITILKDKKTDDCPNCHGLGFVNIEFIKGQYYLCRNCNGRGCYQCDFTGVIDWIDNVRKIKSE